MNLLRTQGNIKLTQCFSMTFTFSSWTLVTSGIRLFSCHNLITARNRNCVLSTMFLLSSVIKRVQSFNRYPRIKYICVYVCYKQTPMHKGEERGGEKERKEQEGEREKERKRETKTKQSFRDETYSSFPSQPTPHNTVETDTSCSPWCPLEEVVNLNVEHMFPQLCFEWELANCLLLLLSLYVWPAILNF